MSILNLDLGPLVSTEDIRKRFLAILEYFVQQQPRTLRAKRRFIQMYRKHWGNVARAARATGLKSTKTFYNWYNKDPVFALALKFSLDTGAAAEYRPFIFELFFKEEHWAIDFYLRYNSTNMRKLYRAFRREEYDDWFYAEGKALDDLSKEEQDFNAALEGLKTKKRGV